MRLGWIFLLACVGLLPTSAHAMSESEVKAAYIYNFALFADWPAQAEEVFSLCTLGMDAVVPHLKALSGKTVRGVELQVRSLSPGDPVRSCRILYIASSENLRAALVRASDARTLTVTDDGLGVASGVMITLQQEGNRVTFSINTSLVRQANITLSSKLLKLAKIVE